MTLSLATPERWERLFNRLGEPSDYFAYCCLVERYGCSNRHYHTITHINKCLAWYDFLKLDSAPLELALWFHDVIYDPYRFDNEENSFYYMLGSISPAVYEKETRFFEQMQLVNACIMATAGHSHIPDDAPDEVRLMCDIDLSILGDEPDTFWEFENNIREEYIHVPDADFRKGRAKILQSFLDMERIYWHPKMFTFLEPQARKNLQDAIDRLETS